jgi:hydrogenase maturation factor
MTATLPLGKIPPALLQQILGENPNLDPRLILGPGIGLDCAVLEMGERCLVLKSDPITFTSDEIGWYAVQINANDIATCGASPNWFLATLLLPEGLTTEQDVLRIHGQILQACAALDISLVGGHTEITSGLERPVIAGTMVGEVRLEKLITPKGACAGDEILLTKCIPIEATAILARERPEALADVLSESELAEAKNYAHQPGISVVREARLAAAIGGVSAMHDPTEGGLLSALWELADACSHTLKIDLGKAPITNLSAKVCGAFEIDPYQAIASGALLLTAKPEYVEPIQKSLAAADIPCTAIGRVEAGPAEVLFQPGTGWIRLPRPQRDELARVLEA